MHPCPMGWLQLGNRPEGDDPDADDLSFAMPRQYLGLIDLILIDFSCCSFSARYTITRVRNGDKKNSRKQTFAKSKGTRVVMVDNSDDMDNYEMWGGRSMVKRK